VYDIYVNVIFGTLSVHVYSWYLVLEAVFNPTLVLCSANK